MVCAAPALKLFEPDSGAGAVAAPQRATIDERRLIPKSAFVRWIESEGIPIYTDRVLEDVTEVKLSPWKRLGIMGAVAYLDGELISTYICEIAPGGQSRAERHLYDERFCVLSGHGETMVWQGEDKKVIARWKAGALFAIPLNAWHQHINTGPEPARLIATNNAPLLMSLIPNLDLIFGSQSAATDRFDGAADFFDPERSKFVARTRESDAYTITNMVRDLYKVQLYPAADEGPGTLCHRFAMAGDSLESHLEEWPSGVYTRARRGHGTGVLILKGSGYSLMWPPSAGTKPFAQGNADKVIRVEWRAGTLLLPPLDWFCQHFNAGPEPARLIGLASLGSRAHALFSTERLSGRNIAIEYNQEDPRIREIFAAELKKNGIPLRMPSVEWLGRDGN